MLGLLKEELKQRYRIKKELVLIRICLKVLSLVLREKLLLKVWALMGCLSQML